MRKKCNNYLSLIVCLMLVLSLAGWTSTKQAASTTTSKDTLSVVITADPANLDPNDSDDQKHYQVTNQIYETLFVYDNNYKLVPWLCSSYAYKSPNTIILKLKKGIRFHNGDELKAKDVLFTFKRVLDKKLIGKISLDKILLNKCKILDDYTLQLVTNGPVATQIAMLENPCTGIMSERAYTQAKGDFLKGAAVGTGPFKYVSYSPGDRIELAANAQYWIKGQPKVKKLEFRIVGDSSSRAIEAETGGADIVYGISAKDVDRISKNKSLKLVSELGTNTSYLMFNTAAKPLNNPKIRQAIWYGIDVAASVKVAYGDFGAVASGWVSPGIKGGDPKISAKFPKRDVKKAKALLAGAGYPNGGLTLHIVVQSSNQERCDLAQAFQGQLAEVGIDLKVDIMEDSAWESTILSGKGQLTIYGLSCTDFEADRALVQLLPSNVNYNICGFNNKEFQDLVNKSLITIDAKKRYELYYKAENLLVNNYITLPLWHKELNSAIKNNISGYRIMRSYEQLRLQNVQFK